jgi:MoaA/NifB/PqqE/SkfB family radical SAM enzyme
LVPCGDGRGQNDGAAVSLEAYHAVRSVDHQPFRSACYAPFVAMSFDPHGTVSVCAFTRASPLGRVGERPLSAMWAGEQAQALRAAVRSDDLAHACSRCEEEIVGGNLHGVLAAGFDRFAAQEAAPWPVRMEFALTNTCNLQCVMCSGEFSSAIRSQREGLPPLPARYGADFLDELTPFLPHLEQARFLGGEPLLGEINFRIWERMIEVGSDPDCNITTNGTVWGPRVERVLDRLRFSVGVSIDGVRRETVETIRHGASYDRIMENLGRFIEYRDRRGTSLSLTFCLMVENWQEFGDYLRFAEDRGCQVYVNTVLQPPRHSLYRLPVGELRQVVAALEAQRDVTAAALTRNRDVWLEQLDRLRAHLEVREQGSEADASSAAGRWQRLVDRLGDPAADEDHLLTLMGEVSVQGSPSVVRVGPDDTITDGDHYVGVDISPFVGRPMHHMLPAVAARYGHRADVLAERVALGAVSRVVAFGEPGGTPTVMVTVTRRGPAPHGTTRIAAILQPGNRAPPPGAPATATPVVLRGAAGGRRPHR